MFSGGCAWFTSPPAGHIFVGRPEVFTRQRLVNRRLGEQNWLAEQLKNMPTDPGFQGYRDVRVFSGLVNKTAVTFDPLGGRLTEAQNELAVQNLRDQRYQGGLQNQLDAVKRQQQIDAQQKLGPQLEEAKLQQQIDTLQKGNTPTASGPTAIPPPPSASATPPVPGAPTPSASTVFSSPPSVPSQDVVATQARLTSIETLRDQLAYRNAVQASLREQELDDSHDLAGLTLYTLKFDVSILPRGTPRDGYGKVEFTLPTGGEFPVECGELWKEYYSWAWHLRRDVNLEAVALQKRLERDLLTEEEKLRLAAHAARYFAKTGDPHAKSLMNVLGADRSVDLDAAKEGAARLIGDKYLATIPPGLVEFKETLRIFIDGRKYYVPDLQHSPRSHALTSCANAKLSEITPKTCRTPMPLALRAATETREAVPATLPNPLGEFHAMLRALDRRPAVFVADPKEQAQNISDVAAAEKLTNMILSIQAILPQYGVTASNYTEYLRRSQERLQAILRRPLIVAYTDEGSKFGWLLGPRFEIGNDGKPRFTHTSVQHSVQTSIVVPGWARTLCLDYRTFWIGPDGSSREQKRGTIDVPIPGDDQAITAQLLAETGTPRTPFIEPQNSPVNERPMIRLQAGKPAEVMIRGQNLWRNPKVFIGGQSTEDVTVLPDMEGLSAKFTSVTMPPRKSKENPVVDLTVVTSEGIASLRSVVQIYPDATVPDDKFALSVDSPFAIHVKSDPLAPLVLSAATDTVPTGFSQLVAKVRPLLPGEDVSKVDRPYLTLPGAPEVKKDSTKVVFRFPVDIPAVAGWPAPWQQALGNVGMKGGVLMQAQIEMSSTPGAKPAPVPSSDGKPLTFAFFPDRQASGGTLSVRGAANRHTAFGPTNAFTNAIEMWLGGDDLLAGIYPTLIAALQSKIGLRFTEVQNGVDVVSTTTQLDAGEFDFAYRSPDGKVLPSKPTALERLGAGPTIVVSTLPVKDKDDPRAAAVKWLKERIADGKAHMFRITIVLAPGIEVPVQPLVTITEKK
jgi:hypothetical protein